MSTSKLPAVGIVANLDPEDVNALASYGTFETTTPGTVVIEQGIFHAKLFLVIEGELKACRNDHGHDVLLGQICAGEWMGEVSLFDPTKTVCSVVATDECRYWVISRDNLEEFINNYPSAGILLLIGLATTLSRRIREVTQKLAEQTEQAKLQESSLN